MEGILRVKEGPQQSLGPDFVAFVEKGNSKEIYIKRQCSQEVWLRWLQKQKINAEQCSLSSVTRESPVILMDREAGI